MMLKSNAEELARIAQDIGAEVIREAERYGVRRRALRPEGLCSNERARGKRRRRRAEILGP